MTITDSTTTSTTTKPQNILPTEKITLFFINWNSQRSRGKIHTKHLRIDRVRVSEHVFRSFRSVEQQMNLTTLFDTNALTKIQTKKNRIEKCKSNVIIFFVFLVDFHLLTTEMIENYTLLAHIKHELVRNIKNRFFPFCIYRAVCVHLENNNYVWLVLRQFSDNCCRIRTATKAEAEETNDNMLLLCCAFIFVVKKTEENILKIEQSSRASISDSFFRP